MMQALDTKEIDAALCKPFTPSGLGDTIMPLFAHRPAGSYQDAVRDNAGVTRYPGVQILVAEDNQLNQVLIARFLEQIGVTVTLASNGQECIDLLTNQPAMYDLVLMDMQMPEMDGLEATRRIRDVLKLKDVPVIALTANVMAEDQKLCLDAGMNDFLAKPVNIPELGAKLETWLPAEKCVAATTAEETESEPLSAD